MGARGKLRLPPHLAVVPEQGDAETAASSVQPIAPEKPDAVASDPGLSALWDELVPVLDKDGLLARSDIMALELALRHFLLARRASEKANVEGLAVADKTHGGEKKNPAEAIFRGESAMFLRYAQQLGLTFAGRARSPARPKGGDVNGGDANPFAAPAPQ